MAARKNKTTLNDGWRNKIRVGMIMNRLDKAAMGEVEMTPSSQRAAEILLKKMVPDLARTELTGKDGDAIKTQQEIAESDKAILERFMKNK